MSSAPQFQSTLVRTELVPLSVGNINVSVDFWYQCIVPEKIESEMLDAVRKEITRDGKGGVRAKATLISATSNGDKWTVNVDIELDEDKQHHPFTFLTGLPQ